MMELMKRKETSFHENVLTINLSAVCVYLHLNALNMRENSCVQGERC